MTPESRIRRRRPLFGVESPLYDPEPIPVRPATRIFDDSTLGEPPSPIVNVGPPPLTTTDRRGRPVIVPGLPATERVSAEQELMGKLQSYEPRKRSTLRQIGMAALRGFGAGGPGGAVAGAIFGTGTALLDPTAEDRAWRDRQIAESQQRQVLARQDQRAGLSDELLRAQVEETRAQAEARRNPRPRLVEQVLPDGTQILTPEAPGVVTGRTRPPTPRIAVDVPGVGPIEATPEAALGYYGQVGRREEDANKARTSLTQAQDAERTYLRQRAEASRTVSDLRARKAQLKPDPSKVGFDGKVNDPDYWAQVDQLDAMIKDAESEVNRRQTLADQAAAEARRFAGEAGSRPAAPTAPPPPPGVTEASIRAEARRRGANEEEAVRRARSFKWIP